MNQVLFITASASRRAGGLFYSLSRLGQSLQQHGKSRVQVLALRDEDAEEDLGAWQPLRPSLFKVLGPRSLGFSPGMLEALSSTQADVAHTHGLWMFPSMAAVTWSRRWRKPYVVSPHGMLDPFALGISAPKKWLASWLYEAAHLKSAACLHALNQSELKAIRAYGLSNPVCVVPNGVDLPALQPAPPRGREKKRLLFLGRLHPKKGLVPLLQAWRLLKARSSARQAGWKLVLAGWDDGGHQALLQDMALDLGLDESVEFAGPKFGTEKEELFRGADAFILPSFSEGLPVAVLEAWAYGLPVLMTEACNLPEGFDRGAAVCVDPTPEDLAADLESFFGLGESQQRKMGSLGRQLAQERFSWPRVAARMEAVYAWLAGGASRPAWVHTGGD